MRHNSRRVRRWESPVCGTLVVVDVVYYYVYMSARISHLKPTRKIFLSHEGLSRGKSMSDCGRRRKSQVRGARVMVDVARQPTRTESQLKPRWKIVPSSCRLRYVCWGGIRCGDRPLCRLAWMWDRIRMVLVACVLEKRGLVILQVVMRCGGR